LISGQARVCGSVGAPKRRVNQEATAGWKLERLLIRSLAVKGRKSP
jgi:hypothetical protein